MSDPLLKIANHHTTACGDPPIVDGSAENCCVGYFENPHGEQWIFTLDRGTGKATLRSGDVGWTTKFDVTNGTVADHITKMEAVCSVHATICYGNVKTARSFLLKLQAVGIDAVHSCGTSSFFGLGLGWLRRLLLLRLAGFVRVMTSAVRHCWTAFLSKLY